jgi:hypothetical protein
MKQSDTSFVNFFYPMQCQHFPDGIELSTFVSVFGAIEYAKGTMIEDSSIFFSLILTDNEWYLVTINELLDEDDAPMAKLNNIFATG